VVSSDRIGEPLFVNVQPLPIDAHLSQILQLLSLSNSLVLEAPPGTGKTTRVAPSLLRLPMLKNAIALIQPRRIAARAAAARIADELGSSLGAEVGYQVRFDSCIGPTTRLISMTPGILLRRLQSDVALERFSAVVLDEFHERSQEMDLLLGMVRQLQQELRPDLKIVIMSATLESNSQLSAYLENSAVIQVEAENYPVQIRHSKFDSASRLPAVRRIVESTSECVRQVAKSADENQGDILVFLPGVGEIMQTLRALQDLSDRDGWELCTLYGDLPADQQDRILMPSSNRRIILSTNIAETSVTIDRVRFVVDSGWARVKRFDPESGLDALRLEPISKASAKQRTGRAGRTQPGTCFRLWDEITGRSRPENLDPEVLRADLASSVLQLLKWGESPEHFRWLTPPHSDSIAQARRLLKRLGAIQEDVVTPLGECLLKFPLHPRLARLLVQSHELGIPAAGAVAAAMLSERDLFLKPDQLARRGRLTRGQPSQTVRRWSCDLTARLRVWSQYLRDGNTDTELGMINPSAARNLSRVSQQFRQIVDQELGPKQELALESQLQVALLAAFPDRLAKRRTPIGTRALMVGSRGVQLEKSSGVYSDLFLCLDVAGGGTEADVRLASGIDLEWLSGPNRRAVEERFFHPTQQAVVTRRREYWLDLMLDEQPASTPLDQETASMLALESARLFERLLPPKDKGLHSLIARIRWLAESMPEAGLPKLDEKFLASFLVDWCSGLRSISEIKQLPWASLVNAILSPDQRRVLDQQAPDSIALPTGRSVLLNYEPGRSPVLAARIQEFFGWATTPKLAGGRIPLMLHLLAPNQRCHQITDDLASFWKNTYPVVRKELRGRYPKHEWPENPLDRIGS